MKNIFNYFIIFFMIIFLLSFNVLANEYDRVNTSTPQISEPLETIKDADGWVLSPYGEWNKIHRTLYRFMSLDLPEPKIGIYGQSINSSLASDHNLNVRSGVFIGDILTNSPADKAGLEENDVILEINSKETDTMDDLLDIILASVPGTKLNVKVIRDNDIINLTIILE